MSHFNLLDNSMGFSCVCFFLQNLEYSRKDERCGLLRIHRRIVHLKKMVQSKVHPWEMNKLHFFVGRKKVFSNFPKNQQFRHSEILFHLFLLFAKLISLSYALGFKNTYFFLFQTFQNITSHHSFSSIYLRSFEHLIIFEDEDSLRPRSSKNLCKILIICDFNYLLIYLSVPQFSFFADIFPPCL